jgi:hypothetical protein
LICSNNRSKYEIISKEEVRFWVRKINPVEKDNIHLREQMAKEIPHFLYFLLHRKLSTRNESRMWFSPVMLETLALQKIKKYNTNKIEMEMASYCSDVMERLGKDSILCCPKDLMDELRDAGLRTADITAIRNILKDSWGLRSESNGDYTFYHIGVEGDLIPMKRKGRYMEVTREVIDKLLL